ncbi:phage major capsid protein [Streptomyces sp. rh34]|uniref:phage major capsid protein n=1 Tax=Streptomyces sp. rh34 TaxID=2034272 RepID=UPI000BF110F5|nr:phage major capsid protein [Streptomyces sp. rh34]
MTTTIPRTSNELAEMLADPAKLAEVMASKESLTSFITSYGEAQQGDGTELNRMVAEETQKVFAQMLKDNGMERDAIKRPDLDPQARRGGMLTSHRQGTAHNPTAPGAVLDKAFANSTEYIRTIWHRTDPTAEIGEKLALLRNAASSVSPADGGFLVPEVLRSQLLQIALEKSIVRPLATVIPMDSARVPMPIIDTTSNQGSVFGGMIAYWGEEGAALEDSNPKFGRVDLDAKKLTGLSAVPNELLQDSIVSFAALIETLWPQALAFSEDQSFMSGNGVGKPLGFMGAKNKAAVAVTRGTASTITYVDIVNMYARMLPSSLSNAVWVCSPDALPQLLQMSLDVGTGGNSVFVVNASSAMPMSIFGRPLIISEKAGQLGARGDIAFVDLAYYLVGDRQTMTVDSSTDFKFGSDKTTFRIIQRVDGRPWLQSAITPANGSANKLSPFVELAA